MTKREKGIILMTSLMLIALLTLIVLSEMQLVQLQLKAVSHMAKSHEAWMDLERATNRIIASSKKIVPSECMVIGDEPNLILDRLKTGKGCLFQFQDKKYVYLIEQLGFFACLQTKRDGKVLGTNHLRLSVLYQGDRLISLQLRLAKAAIGPPCEGMVAKRIKEGILSYRGLG